MPNTGSSNDSLPGSGIVASEYLIGAGMSSVTKKSPSQAYALPTKSARNSSGPATQSTFFRLARSSWYHLGSPSLTYGEREQLKDND